MLIEKGKDFLSPFFVSQVYFGWALPVSHNEIDLVLSHNEILKSHNETVLSLFETKNACNLLFCKGLCVPYYIII